MPKLPLLLVLRYLEGVLPPLGVPFKAEDVKPNTLVQPVKKHHNAILAYLKKITLVGILPVPHPFLIRHFNGDQSVWFNQYIWGLVFLQHLTEYPIFSELAPSLFLARKLNELNEPEALPEDGSIQSPPPQALAELAQPVADDAHNDDLLPEMPPPEPLNEAQLEAMMSDEKEEEEKPQPEITEEAKPVEEVQEPVEEVQEPAEEPKPIKED